MEIILSKQCQSLTGSLGPGFGYFIAKRHRKDGSVRFFAQRSKHPNVPPDGHLKFILACAELAADGLLVANISVPLDEFLDALHEAYHGSVTPTDPLPHVLSAADINDIRRKGLLIQA